MLDGYEGFVWNIYAGGGIMGASEVDSEWQETELKMAPLYRCLTAEPRHASEGKTFSTVNPVTARFTSNRLPF